MKILAVILARGGSKRLPGKNILRLGEKPLINWSIDVVKGIPEIIDVLVSTDDQEIANVSKKAGAMVPWLRPSSLSADTSSSVDALLHAMDWYEGEKGSIDGVLLLQPTSPFRTKKTILEGIQLFRVNKDSSIVGVSPAESHPLWAVKINQNKIVPYIEQKGFTSRSQDLPEAFTINGNFYLISPRTLKEELTFFVPDRTIPLLARTRMEGLDIDDPDDFELAKAYIKLNDH
jgi:N-acylneuraminate cytidylyltransferase